MNKHNILSVRLTDEDMTNLRSLASLHDCTVSDYVRQVLIVSFDNKRAWLKFICEACKNGMHGDCSGISQCDCQHRKSKV